MRYIKTIYVCNVWMKLLIDLFVQIYTYVLADYSNIICMKYLNDQKYNGMNGNDQYCIALLLFI